MRRFYERYIGTCNDHRFAALGTFVADDVHVDGHVRGLERYIMDLQSIDAAFPDYHWDLQHTAQEFAFYRIRESRIAEIWSRADDHAIIGQLRGEHPAPQASAG